MNGPDVARAALIGNLRTAATEQREWMGSALTGGASEDDPRVQSADLHATRYEAAAVALHNAHELILTLRQRITDQASTNVWPVFGGIPVRLIRALPVGAVYAHPDTFKITTAEELRALSESLKDKLGGPPAPNGQNHDGFSILMDDE